jgi:hypothetical protein
MFTHNKLISVARKLMLLVSAVAIVISGSVIAAPSADASRHRCEWDWDRNANRAWTGSTSLVCSWVSVQGAFPNPLGATTTTAYVRHPDFAEVVASVNLTNSRHSGA